MAINRGFALSLPLAPPPAVAAASLQKGLAGLFGAPPVIAAAAASSAAASAVVWGIARPAVLEAHADAAALSARHASFADFWDTSTVDDWQGGRQRPSELKPLLGVFHPLNAWKVLLRNVAIHCMARANSYMAELLEVEKQTLEAEEMGEQPPPPPPWPAWEPPVEKGLWATARELTVAFVRRIYEHLLSWRLPANRAGPFLRNGKAWIKDVLAVRHRSAPLGVRYKKYVFAMAHSLALFYLAECTVSVALVAHDTLKGKTSQRLRTPRERAARIAKHVVLQAGRCTFVLVLVSLGSAGGSLIKPGIVTTLAHVSCDHAGNMLAGLVIATLDS